MTPRHRFIGFAVLIPLVTLGACVHTTYTAYDELKNETPFLTRQVRYELTDAFYRDPPDCVIVLQATGSESIELAKIVERSVARHLSEKVPRVIGPAERRRAVRDLAVDLADARAQRHLATSRGCRFLLRPTVVAVDDTYIVLWSQRTIELSLAMFRASDGATLWRAAHTVRRGDGGLPISPLSLGSAAIRAGWAKQDQDAVPSMVDDAARRIFTTLPDVR